MPAAATVATLMATIGAAGTAAGQLEAITAAVGPTKGYISQGAASGGTLSEVSMETVCITRDVYDAIISSVGSLAAETGGILAMNSDGVICAFQFDHWAAQSSIIYTPSMKKLSFVINSCWVPNRLSFCGIVHSHPIPSAPSPRDVLSCREIMEVNHMDSILLPIVVKSTITMYILERFSPKPLVANLRILETGGN